MSGCAAFAQVVDPTRIEAELLPQWWEQVNSTHRPFPSSCEPHYKSEAKCKVFIMKISFVCI